MIHGGAGTMVREGSTPEQRERYHTALREALRAGHEVLKQGGEAMDAAVAAVSSMEGVYPSSFHPQKRPDDGFLQIVHYLIVQKVRYSM